VVNVGSWGRLGLWPHDLHPLTDRSQRRLPGSGAGAGLAYGMGRSYGDVCLNPGGTLWSTRTLDKFIGWDARAGVLTCEAGVLLRDIQRLVVPRGWMLPVTPGTQYVTVGGAIANDVHGKNHHRLGSFGDHVLRLELLRSDGETIVCGPGERDDWYAATVGGLGLTGVILQASLQLRPVPGPWLQAETIAYESLAEFLALADASEDDWEYTVSWIDCSSGRRRRGLFMRANHAAEAGAAPRERKLAVPFTPPVPLINRWSLAAFNAAYYHLHSRRPGRHAVHYEPFFYPLDHVLEWNRIYGPRGFYQYQCVVPRSAGAQAIDEMLREIAAAGDGSFLAVLKTFGARQAPGMLSFPQPGVTLALDFPNRGGPTERLLARLDAVLQQAGGRIYPAKDARMSASLFQRGYPLAAAFGRFRDPGVGSAFARRVLEH
jgi:FAD/FMN-containing dehydrogenase